jgi:hypothetical protein
MQRKNGMTEFQALLASGNALKELHSLQQRFNEGKKLSAKESRLLESLKTWHSLRQPQNHERIHKYSKEQRLPKDLVLASKRRQYRKLEKIENKGKRPRLFKRPIF